MFRFRVSIGFQIVRFSFRFRHRYRIGFRFRLSISVGGEDRIHPEDARESG